MKSPRQRKIVILLVFAAVMAVLAFASVPPAPQTVSPVAQPPQPATQDSVL